MTCLGVHARTGAVGVALDLTEQLDAVAVTCQPSELRYSAKTRWMLRSQAQCLLLTSVGVAAQVVTEEVFG